MECLNILPPNVRASKIRLSYVEELFPDLKDNPYIVLHKNTPDIQSGDYENKEECSDEYTMTHDMSGSPLEYSFGNCNFEDTIVVTKHSWLKEDESYLPLSKIDACNALNLCLEHLTDNTLPILALCDGKDSKQSRFIGIIVSDEWFTTLECVSTGVIASSTIKNNCRKLIQEHLKQSFVQEHEITMSMLNIFDLFGTKKEEIDWDKTAKSDIEGSINIETYSNNLILNPKLSKNTLILQVNGEWKNSPLKELQQQLYLLIQYLSVIDQCKIDIGTQNSIKFTTPYLEEPDVITKELNLLLNGDINLRKSVNSNIGEIYCTNKENAENDTKLLARVQNLSSRYDADFTDRLWEILIESSEYPQMINYIEMILKEILKHKYVLQIDDTNSTRFIKYVSDIHRRETLSDLLMGSMPLELVVDMGFKKLTRDYLHILRGVRFVDVYDIRQKLANISSGIFSTEHYRKKLIILAQIHICLECMLFVEAHLECMLESLQSIFAHIYKQFFSEQSPLQHYDEFCNRFYTLTMPLPNTVANELNKINPTLWKASLSSQSAASMLTTTTYYSKTPIFPTNIYPTDDVNAQEEIVYGISAISSSTKYKKLRKATLSD